MRNRTILRESGRDRLELAVDAGFGSFSFTSVLAGVLVAYGAFSILAGLAASVVAAVGDDTDLTGDWERLGTTGGLIVAALLLLAYLFGGYVAGRMARFDGMRQGIAVWVIGLLVVLLLALLGLVFGSQYNVLSRLDLPRIPVDEGSLTTGGIIALVATILVTLLAAISGGKVGERFHRKVDAAGHGHVHSNN